MEGLTVLLIIAGIFHFGLNIRMIVYLYSQSKPTVLELIIILFIGWVIAVIGWFLQDVLDL
jgi:hypothetical protein